MGSRKKKVNSGEEINVQFATVNVIKLQRQTIKPKTRTRKINLTHKPMALFMYISTGVVKVITRRSSQRFSKLTAKPIKDSGPVSVQETPHQF